mmetsp:Transcript_19790/g.34067  ORF Transcript_19790/g.34067 Transcript_19790/m.34067 type:complete len:247 (-) Transcript_19790:87-827(-)|eukprot:CAMPEP_0196657898 /NCGR_PEP_ID=MMETSP1086-20130531/26322_1 /TAXON_ID=77921 /ORGANISM="Cyanoptyche  gloeocystis , Strain SAG4.97" /LENGTH=246 /DNA_ID=CAMNT_0041991219 /DNA_START=37 /DNA_END=777 /DNA_ORIENTATION=-
MALQSVNYYLFLDLDDTLYPASLGIGHISTHRIRLFLKEHLGIHEDNTIDYIKELQRRHGPLIVRGVLANHPEVDPDVYNEFVDGSLPLEEKLQPEPGLDRLLENIRPDVQKWIFTNAGIKHAERVLKILNISHHFHGIIYCNYSEQDFPSKPHARAFAKAMAESGAVDQPGARCIFVDDNVLNCYAAREFGWTAVHLTSETQRPTADHHRIQSLLELPTLFPDLFLDSMNAHAHTLQHDEGTCTS